MGPDAQALQDGAAVVGQGNLAAVEGRLGQGLARLGVHQGHAQAAAAQRAGQTQAGRTGPGDENVELHGAVTVTGPPCQGP